MREVHLAIDTALSHTFDRLPMKARNGLVGTIAVGAVLSSVVTSAGLTTEGDALWYVKALPYVVSEAFNICDSPTENQKADIKAAIQEGRDYPFRVTPLFETSKPGTQTLLEAIQ